MDGLSAPRKKEPKKLLKKSEKIIKSKKENMSNNNSFLSTLISIIVTAAIVGGAIYAWQDRTKVDSLNKVQQDAKSTREGFERSLKSLENKVRMVEDENLGLKSENDQLKDKAELVKGAIKIFSNEELGLSFSFPAIFGDATYERKDGNPGEIFSVRFPNNPNFYLSGVTDKFNEEKISTSTDINFNQFVKFTKTRNNYTAIFSRNGENFEYDLKPVEVITTAGGEVLLVDKNSFVVGENQDNIDIGQNIGALLNTKKDGFSGVSFVNSDFGQLTLDEFKNVLKSIELN